MTKKRKAFTLGLILLMVLTSFPLMAYDFNTADDATNEPAAAKPMAGGPRSPTNKASAGRYTTDVDNALHLTNWTGVNVDSWLAFAGWDNNLFSLGYARKIGGIYLGAWYNGNVVAAGEEDTEYVSVTYDAYGNPTEEEGGYTSNTTQPWVYSNNRLGLLVGLGIWGMGIKLDVKENYLSKDLPQGSSNLYTYTEDKATGQITRTNEVSEYKYLKGWTDIYAGWGMTLPVAGLSIKPRAQLGVQLYSNDQNTVYKDAYPVGTPYEYTNVAADTQQGKNTAFVRPNILVGANLGGLPWGLGVDLEYSINFDIYTSSYDLYGGSESVAGDVSWDFGKNYSFSNTTLTERISATGGGVTLEEKSRLQQIITPSLTYGTNISDNVRFALKLDLPFTVGSATSGGKYTKTWSTTVITPTGGDTTVTEKSSTTYTSGESETSILGVAPALYIGTQVAAIPNRLTLNLGLTNGIKYSSKKTLTKPAGIDVSTEKTTVGNLVTVDTKDGGSIGTKKDTSAIEKSWTDLSAKISAGFTFFFSPNFLVDTYFTTQITDEAGKTDTNDGISFGNTNFWNDVVAGKFGLMFTIKK